MRSVLNFRLAPQHWAQPFSSAQPPASLECCFPPASSNLHQLISCFFFCVDAHPLKVLAHRRHTAESGAIHYEPVPCPCACIRASGELRQRSCITMLVNASPTGNNRVGAPQQRSRGARKQRRAVSDKHAPNGILSATHYQSRASGCTEMATEPLEQRCTRQQ